MKELICQCGVCKRESLFECRCGFAAKDRCKVVELLAGRDMSTDDARQAAYDAVVKAFIDDYGGQHVLATPRSTLSWLVPYAAIGGGLVLLYGFGRRWVSRGRTAVTSAAAQSEELSPEDEDYAEMLDDELRDTD